MAITINGSGTISGVSVGGLPDGIVDTDMIAANAVTVSKLPTSIDLSGNTVTMPSGRVVDVVTNVFTSSGSGDSVSFTATGLSASITPKATGNKLVIVVCQFLGRSPSTHARLDFGIARSAPSSSTIARQYYVGHDGNVGSVWQFINPIVGVDTAASTATHTYFTEIRKANATSYEANSWWANGYGASSNNYMIIYEVEQ